MYNGLKVLAVLLSVEKYFLSCKEKIHNRVSIIDF